jgi:hypothetical protein
MEGEMMKKLLIAALVLAMVSSVYAAAPSTTGMQLWLKADAGVSQDTSGNVLTWADSSPQGNDFFAQPTQEPGYAASYGPQAMPSVTFGLVGGEDYMTANDFVSFGDWTIFAVSAGKTHNPTWGASIFADYGVGWGDGLHLDYDSGSGHTGSTAGWYGHARSSAGGPQVDVYAYQGGTNDGTSLKVLTTSLDSSTGSIKLWASDEGLVASGQDTNYQATDLTGTGGLPTIGTNSRSYAGGLNGYISEIIIYDSALSDTDRTAVEAYLYNKYIPEPATIALLGLGGLALIRKRR